MIGTKIITEENAEKLEIILIKTDRTHAPLGSGGYSVREESLLPDGTMVVLFTELDCAPARTFPAFIKEGMIYANKIAWVIMAILKGSGISFTAHSDIVLPDNICKYLKRKL